MSRATALLVTLAAVLAAIAGWAYAEVPPAVGHEVGFAWLFANVTLGTAVAAGAAAWLSRRPVGRGGTSARVLAGLLAGLYGLLLVQTLSGWDGRLVAFWPALPAALALGALGELMRRPRPETPMGSGGEGREASR